MLLNLINIICGSIYISVFLQPFTKRQILDSSKLKEFADNNFRFDENGRKLYKQVENTVGKGEIACYKAISPFPRVFSKGLLSRGVKRCHCVGMGYLFTKQQNLA